jgi:hypothetical protein
MSYETEYRAAYWISDDRQGEVRLTGPEHRHLSDADLVAEAKAEIARAGVQAVGGAIKIGSWVEVPG